MVGIFKSCTQARVEFPVVMAVANSATTARPINSAALR